MVYRQKMGSFTFVGCLAIAALTLTISGCEQGGDLVPDETASLVGEVEILVATYEDHEEVLHFLVTEDGERARLFFDDDPKLESGDQIEVSGTKNSDGEWHVASFEFLLIQPRSLEVPGQLRPPLLHKVAILRLNNTDITSEKALSTIDTVDSFYRENSNDIDYFTGKVFGPYQVNTSDCKSRYGSIKDDALAAFAAQGNNKNDFSHIAIVIPKDSGCGWGGLGQVGRPGKPAQITWYANWFDCRVTAHELGHNLGMNHSHSLKCGNNVYSANGEGCTMTEYGHVFDNMGDDSCKAHYSAPQKQYQGWLEKCEDVTAGRSAVFNLSPLEGKGGIRSLRIPIAGENKFYYVEYRENSSGDYAGAKGEDRVLVSVSNDGIVERVNASLLDFNPATTSFSDGWLTVGTNYPLPGGVEINVLNQGDTARIRVVMTQAGQHTCAGGTKPPVAQDGSIGLGNVDDCPNDPDKTTPGVCGCGVADVDTDTDGTFDCQDNCPNDKNKTSPGQCGCGVAEGTCSGNVTSYQAEDNTSKNGANLASNHAGYTGAGFMDYGGNGTWIEWNNVKVAQAGEYLLTLRYANAGSTRQCVAIANGQNQGNIGFANTGGWTAWITDKITVSLKAGNNTIRVMANTPSGGPNLDKMELTLLDACPSDPNKTEAGECGCGVPEGSCGNEENVALGKNTRQSSTAYGGLSSRAVDGNTGGAWNQGSVTHTANTATPWWIVDLGASHRLSGVTIWNRTDCCSNRLSNFRVDYLDEIGEVIATITHAATAGVTTNIDLTASGVHSVRIQLNGSNFLSLAEVEVWGETEPDDASLCVQTAEGSIAMLSCPNGQTMVSVDFASYGLPTGSCDAAFATGTCHAETSQYKVETFCLNKPSCAVAASNGVFGDPCAGKPKQLAIIYTCR